MFDALKALTAELKTEAEAFVHTVEDAVSSNGIVTEIVKDVAEVLALVKSAHVTTKDSVAKVEQAVTDMSAAIKTGI